MKIRLKFTHLQAIQYIKIKISDKFSITSLAHQWILCSEWVPSEWESKQLWKCSKTNYNLQSII